MNCIRRKLQHCLHLASFPGRSHLQYLTAYSMQNSIWSLTVCKYLHTVSDQILEVGTAWERGSEIYKKYAEAVEYQQL